LVESVVLSECGERNIMYLILHKATVSLPLLRALSGVVVFSLRLSLLRD